MGDLAELFKTLGIVSGSFAVVAGMTITLLRYVLKSIEQKNNVIGTHVQRTADVIAKQAEATNQNTDVLQSVRDVINQNTIVLTNVKELVQDLARRRD